MAPRHSWKNRHAVRPANTDLNTGPQYDTPDPVPETVRGVVNPYRGMETHGVEPDPAQWQRGPDLVPVPDDEHFTDPAQDIEPLPVRIVRASTDEYAAFTVSNQYVTTTPQQITGRNKRQRKVTVKHVGPADGFVYIGHNMSVNPTSGWIITLGQTFVVETSEPVWAVCGQGTGPFTLAVLSEFTVDPINDLYKA